MGRDVSYGPELGARLRAIRTQQGLSLQGVEQKSRGRWKAVVIGSYERGDRAVTAERQAELAAFYRVPVAELLPHGAQPPRTASAASPPRLTVDLERLQQTAPQQRAPLARYTAAIQQQRGDYNARVLSLRAEDVRALSSIYGTTPSELREQLLDAGVLVAGSPPAAAASDQT